MPELGLLIVGGGRQPEISQNDAARRGLGNAEQSETAEKFEREPRRTGVVHVEQAVDHRLPVVAYSCRVQGFRRRGAFLHVARGVEHDRLQCRRELLRERRAGYRLQEKAPQLCGAIRRLHNGEDFLAELRAHEARR